MIWRRLSLPSAILRRAFTTTRTARAQLTNQQIEIVKSTIPALEKHGVEITTLFYRNMLDQHPELKNIFNTAHQATGEQPAALAHAVWAYASNIEHPEALATAVSRIGHKHASLGVTADQYTIVGKYLLESIQQVLGDAVTEPVRDAWTAAYQQLAEIFSNFEDNLYQQALATPGGWKGWRKFRIANKIYESDEIISFHLTPIDQGALPAYQPGQFVSVRCFVPELGVYQPRQYSLSDVPNRKYFQVSVKKEFAAGARPAGRISNVLHESLPVGAELEVSMPFGDFVLDVNRSTPVVLLSGGVGLTPMMSMLKAITAASKARRVVFVHAARNSRVHAMKDTLAQIQRENPQVSRAIFYEQTTADDRQGVDYDYAGRVDVAKIQDQVVLPDADYYICGPSPFMKAQSQDLQRLGVDLGRIHMEVFGSPT
ncbi:flavodoxin reductases (ferredoxin-NADPH reductases) family 1 [Aspergillus homomorphus CBS 101889]|uniref:nitric oxide dioxygenase n=1 Tax=Aspergillus homomorphus (strain CBS 101889) TaxID=1450537 RepID=A0A395HZY0_ASPHC|nr:flavodoxin reductases (ferredoxin-NADPH reductases) family 1 [Aspergillus homomorphus CBS 101889]RAL13360.1 flavodoxin reductases (ferredoxin-NADPH reductases) family 1 [Aspergillus homomorphus CBS 101889]